jgi:hypothetical protein
MVPKYGGERITCDEEAALFIDSVLAPIADELAGGSFIESPLGLVSRSQEENLDSEDESWAEIGFSAVKLYHKNNQPRVSYMMWVHSEIPLDEMNFLYDADNPYIEPDDDAEHRIIEEREFTLNGSTLLAHKTLDYVFYEDDEEVNRQGMDDDFEIVDIPDPEEADRMVEVADEVLAEFDVEDMRVISGILGRLGLMQKPEVSIQ